MIDLCFMYADIGLPHYKAVAWRMVQSTNGTGSRVVQFGAQESDRVMDVDILSVGKVTKKNLTLARIEMMKDHAKRFAQGHMAMCDADLVWQNSPEPLFETNDFDIGLMWRQGNIAMPYCAAMVLIRHGSEAAHHFLHKWFLMDLSLPEEMWRWYGDQVSLSCMLGVSHKPNTVIVHDGVRVKLFDGGQMIYTMKGEDSKAPANALARHYKGATKEMMLAA